MSFLRFVLLGTFITACGQAPLNVPESEAGSGDEVSEDVVDVVMRSDSEALDCPVVFPESVRASWQDISGERYRIDASGRPVQAIALLPPIAPDARDESCQRQVGQWGDAMQCQQMTRTTTVGT